MLTDIEVMRATVPSSDARDGLAALLVSHRAALLRFLRARCGGDSEAEDILQEMWLRLLAGTGIGPVANPRAYLFRMANNLVLDTRRMRQRAMQRDHAWLGLEGRADVRPEDVADPALGIDQYLAARQEENFLAQAIDALPPGAARALRLCRLEGHQQAEVAKIMGISRSGVEKHLALAMKHLRKNLLARGLISCGSGMTETSDGRENSDRDTGSTEHGS